VSGLSPARAVLVGHLLVTVPALVIVGGAIWFARIRLGADRTGPALLLGCAVAWLWWSCAIPWWRQWAHRRGADRDAVQRLGVRTGLVWPKGSFLERTEFRRKSSD
jgi:hypothetical protein